MTLLPDDELRAIGARAEPNVFSNKSADEQNYHARRDREALLSHIDAMTRLHKEEVEKLRKEIEQLARTLTVLGERLAEAREIMLDLVPYAQTAIGLPRSSWPYDSVILRAERALSGPEAGND